MPSQRILFLNTRLVIGGPAKVTASLAEELRRRGHHVVLAAGDPEPGEALDPRATTTSVPRRHIPGLRRPVRPWRDLVTLLRVRSLLATECPEVLITTGAKAGALGRLAARLLRRGPQTIHVFHGHVFRGHFSARAGKVFATVERLLARMTDDVVAICRTVEEDLRQLRIDRHTRLHTIFIGDDLSPYLQLGAPTKELHRELGLDPEVMLVVYPARICPVKAQELMIEALAIGKDDMDPHGFKVLFVGDGEGREKLEDRARELGVGDRIRVLGYREDMRAIYRDADLVALASHSEGTPLSLLEAVASGRRYLATAVGGIPEIHDDETGWLVPPGDPKQLARALSDILAQGPPPPVPEERRREIVRRFSPTRWADEMERLIVKEER